ncbi:MAG: hypothetical protein KDC44_20215, partial [Phaeodactylibacter sp.]|nr:hypothetical protein [Phaeodactylibacter sp.]
MSNRLFKADSLQLKQIIPALFVWILPFSAFGQSIKGPLPQLAPANVSSYDIDVGLPLSCTNSCEVDRQGRLWINPCFSQEEHRTVNFFQFDGREAYSVTWPALPPGTEGQATIVGQEQTGRLIGFFRNTHYCFRFDPESHEVQLFSLPSAKSDILHMALNPSGVIVVYAVNSGEHQLYRLQDDRLADLVTLPLKGSVPGNNLLPHLHLLTENNYWFFDYELEFETLNLPEDYAQRLGTLKRIDLATGTVTSFSLQQIMGDEIPFPIALVPSVRLEGDRQGHVHLFLAPWLRHFELDPNSETFREYQVFENLADQMVDSRYQYFFMMSDEVGNFLYAFYNKDRAYEGVLVDTAGNWYDYSSVLNAAVDRSRFEEGVIYHIKSRDLRKQLFVCMEGGIAAVELKFYNAIRVFSWGKPTRAIVELRPNTYYFVREGDKGAALLALSQSDDPVLTDFAGFECSGNYVEPNAIYGDAKKGPSGAVWLTFKENLLRIDPDGACTEYPVGFPFEKFVQFNEQQFLLEKRGKLSIYDLQQKRAYPMMHEGREVALNARINQMYQAPDGVVWIATLKGLWKIDFNQDIVRKYGTESGFSDNRIMCINGDENGDLWLGTYGSGLQIFNPETGDLKVVDRKEGLSNNTIVGILQDADGLRWVSSYKGISLLTEDGRVITQLFEDDGLSTNEFNRYSFFKDSAGRLLFGSIHGINMIDPQLLKSQLLDTEHLRIYLTGLTQYQVGREQEVTRRVNLDPQEPLLLPAAHRYLRLEFALSSYVKPEDNQFSYRILDRGRKKVLTDWTFIGANAELNLNSLPAGHLQVEVRARDHRGNWTPESLQVPVDVKDFFYNQTWFYLLIGGLIFAGVAAWLYRQRLTRHRLEQQIQERTEEILKTRDQLIVQEKLASLGQLTAGIAHEIKNPLTP